MLVHPRLRKGLSDRVSDRGAARLVSLLMRCLDCCCRIVEVTDEQLHPGALKGRVPRCAPDEQASRTTRLRQEAGCPGTDLSRGRHEDRDAAHACSASRAALASSALCSPIESLGARLAEIATATRPTSAVSMLP